MLLCTVAEVKSDGQDRSNTGIIIHRRRDVLDLSVTEPAPNTTSESTMLTYAPGCLVIDNHEY